MVVVCVGGVIWEMLTGRERRRMCVIKSGIKIKMIHSNIFFIFKHKPAPGVNIAPRMNHQQLNNEVERKKAALRTRKKKHCSRVWQEAVTDISRSLTPPADMKQ